MESMAKIIIKAQLGDDIRRIPIHNDCPCFEELRDMMKRVFKDHLDDSHDFVIKCKDEDNDFITISDDSELEFSIDSSSIVGENKILRLMICKKKEDQTDEKSEALDSIDRRTVVLELRKIRDFVTVLADKLDSMNVAPVQKNGDRNQPFMNSVDRREFDPIALKSSMPNQRRSDTPESQFSISAHPPSSNDISVSNGAPARSLVGQPQQIHPSQPPSRQDTPQQQYPQPGPQVPPPTSSAFMQPVPQMPPMGGLPQQGMIPPAAPGMPPMSSAPGMMPPGPRPMSGQMPMPPTSMPGPQQGGVPMSQPGMPPMSQPGMPPMSQPGMMPMSQPGMPPVSMPPMAGMPPQGHPGFAPGNQPPPPHMMQPPMGMRPGGPPPHQMMPGQHQPQIGGPPQMMMPPHSGPYPPPPMATQK